MTPGAPPRADARGSARAEEAARGCVRAVRLLGHRPGGRRAARGVGVPGRRGGPAQGGQDRAPAGGRAGDRGARGAGRRRELRGHRAVRPLEAGLARAFPRVAGRHRLARRLPPRARARRPGRVRARLSRLDAVGLCRGRWRARGRRGTAADRGGRPRRCGAPSTAGGAGRRCIWSAPSRQGAASCWRSGAWPRRAASPRCWPTCWPGSTSEARWRASMPPPVTRARPGRSSRAAPTT